jgi:hypothetical protein
VTNSQDDDEIQDLISAATELMSSICNRVFLFQTQTLTLDYIPQGELEWWDGVRDGAISAFQRRDLPLINPPLVSVVEVATYDLNNNRIVYDAANYFVDNTDPDQFGRICLNIGSIWPVDLRRSNAVEVLITAGYTNDDPENIYPYPLRAKLALKQLVAYLYEHRGEEASTSAPEDSGAMGWLRPLIVYSPTIAAPRNEKRVGRLW